MTQEQKTVLMRRLEKLSKEADKISPYFEDNDIHPGNFGITSFKGGYELWIEDGLPNTNLMWGIQVYVEAEAISDPSLPLEEAHILPVFETLKDIKAKQTLDPSRRDTRVTYLNQK